MFYPNSKRSACWDAIKAAMGEWVANRPEPKTWNNSLRAYISVTGRTMREIPYWGSKRTESTTAICEHLNEILRFAVKKEEVMPRSNSSRKFQKLIILERKIEGLGVAKLTVGLNQEGELVQYCITVPPEAVA